MVENVTLARAGHIATVAIDNPGKLNAITLSGWGALGSIIGELSGDTDVRCVVVRGAGEEAFSAGADIAEFPDVRATAAQARDYGAVVAATLEALGACPHPMVAAIRGVCTGGGLEIASTCDIRIAGRSARLGAPINRLGHAFAYPELEPVIAAFGRALAVELTLEGRVLDADEALRRGMVSRVVADQDLDAEVAATAERIATGAPLVNRWAKKFARRLAEPEPLTEAELMESYDLCDSEDYAEGLRAFLAKEKPDFKGR